MEENVRISCAHSSPLRPFKILPRKGWLTNRTARQGAMNRLRTTGSSPTMSHRIKIVTRHRSPYRSFPYLYARLFTAARISSPRSWK